jgi:hypothetical protein
MGYTIYTIAKNDEAKEKMISFAEKHFPKMEYSRFAFGYKNGGLSYVDNEHKNNNNVLGFDYNSGAGADRYLSYRLLEWVCSKVSDEPELYFYDGEKMEWEKKYNLNNMTGNNRRETGRVTFFLNRSLSNEETDKQIQEILDKINEVIDNLEKTWNSQIYVK